MIQGVTFPDCSNPGQFLSAPDRVDRRSYPLAPKKLSRLTEALLEMAEYQHQLGLMDDATYRKIRIRHLGEEANRLAQPISPDEFRTLRERTELSQTSLAIMLNMTVDYLSQLESGVKQPKGAALARINIVSYKGIEAIL